MQAVMPVVLEGTEVRLEPVEKRHAADLAEAFEMEFFRYFPTIRPAAETEEAFIEFITAVQALPNTLGFAIIKLPENRAVGMTTYMDIRQGHRGLEVGMTWLAKAHQGTRVNPEAKLLLLTHAFEVLGCERVQLKTDARNLQSQRAIEKMGAKKEGVLRSHLVMPDGLMRDSVMYSVIKEEWPGVKEGLLARLAASRC